MDIPSLFQQLGIALGLGLLVGLQRESAASPLAGVRTFPLVTVLGTVCGLLSQAFGGWILAAGITDFFVLQSRPFNLCKRYALLDRIIGMNERGGGEVA
jgi:hypothetical protein